MLLGFEPDGDGSQYDPNGYEAIIQALFQASEDGEIKIHPFIETEIDTNGNEYHMNTAWRTTVDVEELKVWLLKKGFKDGFFFPEVESSAPEYLNPLNKNYSQHLAYAIQAWEAMQIDGAIPKSKTPKNTMVEWLEQFELSTEAKERIATVVNWKKGGSA